MRFLPFFYMMLEIILLISLCEPFMLLIFYFMLIVENFMKIFDFICCLSCENLFYNIILDLIKKIGSKKSFITYIKWKIYYLCYYKLSFKKQLFWLSKIQK